MAQSHYKASTIAQFLNTNLIGQDIPIKGFSTLDECKAYTLVFANKFTCENIQKLQHSTDALAIVTVEFTDLIKCPHVVSTHPRLDYLRALQQFFCQEVSSCIHHSAVIDSSAKIGDNVSIGANSYIGRNVRIGDRTQILSNVVIDNGSEIGSDCYIKSGAVVGQEGFGFEINEKGVPEHFPHFGKVIIGNHVFIGSNSSVERATLGNTKIEDHVKIDDLVQIGHNSVIGRNTMITVGALICGGVVIEENAYIAPNVTIKEKLRIGRYAFLGMSAVIIKSVAEHTTIVGNPGKPFLRKD